MSSIKGIRYARAERFGLPKMETIPADCRKDEVGKYINTEILVCPQAESQLGGVNGPESKENPFSEDCLRLSIFKPDDMAEGETLPVMVWFCGGAYVKGSGLFSRYDATRLCNEGHIMVVSVSYRVGIFGWLWQPEEGSVNLGLMDLRCSLEWIHNYIHLFGGDSERITLCGQSAGAQTIACLISTLDVNFFRKAILFSAPLGISVGSDHGEKIRKDFTQRCPDFRTAGFDALIKAQTDCFWESRMMMPFAPVDVPAMPVDNMMPGLEEVLLTWQKDDATVFTQTLPCKNFLAWLTTRWLFKYPGRKFLGLLGKRGVKTHTHEFSWLHKTGRYGACHSLEMALIFGSWEKWSPADFLSGATKEDYEKRGFELRREIASFVNG